MTAKHSGDSRPRNVQKRTLPKSRQYSSSPLVLLDEKICRISGIYLDGHNYFLTIDTHSFFLSQSTHGARWKGHCFGSPSAQHSGWLDDMGHSKCGLGSVRSLKLDTASISTGTPFSMTKRPPVVPWQNVRTLATPSKMEQMKLWIKHNWTATDSIIGIGFNAGRQTKAECPLPVLLFLMVYCNKK